MLYKITTILLLFVCKVFFKLKVSGKENILRNKPFILASNHLSNLDPIILAVSVFPSELNFLAKEELFRNCFFNLYLRCLHAIPLRRGKADIAALRTALNILKHSAIIIFPQGTRSSNFDNINFGVGFLKKKANVPIVAVKIRGSENIFPKGAKFLRRGRLEVSFGRVSDILKEDNSQDITLKVVNRIKSL